MAYVRSSLIVVVIAVVGIELIDVDSVRTTFDTTDATGTVDSMFVDGIGIPVFLVERICFAASSVFFD
jgi:hypothetical protein